MIGLGKRVVRRQLDRIQVDDLIFANAFAVVELELEVVENLLRHGYLTTIVVAVAFVRA